MSELQVTEHHLGGCDDCNSAPFFHYHQNDDSGVPTVCLFLCVGDAIRRGLPLAFTQVTTPSRKYNTQRQWGQWRRDMYRRMRA
jgi:hypothetical protein